MPPVILFAIGVVGAAVLVRWCAREAQRVNAELNDVRARAAVEPIDRNALPKLKRIPRPANIVRDNFSLRSSPRKRAVVTASAATP